MIVSYANEVYCVNIDWLQFSVHLGNSTPEIICPKGYRLELCQGNNIFEYRALVFTEGGQKVLTLLWHPYSSVLPQNLMTCQVANEWLYLNGLGIKWAWELLQEIVECTFNAIGRVDICIDFQGTPERTAFLSHLNSNHYYVQGKKEGSTWWHTLANGAKQLHCLTWGSQTSEIKVKVYHKSREQGVMDGDKDKAAKPYIVTEWESAGLDITNVWRLEFSLSGVGQLRWNGQPITFANLMDNGWVTQVLCELYHARFVTRVNQGRRHGHKNEDKRVWLIPLPPRASHLSWQEAKLERKELPAAIKVLRTMMAQIDNPAIVSSKVVFTYYADTITKLIRDYALEGYFRRVWQTTSAEYIGNIASQAGTGIHEMVASPARLMS